ncbi:MFS transporter [Pseudooceanicola sp. LIPI14-2-Ac024]|uniref:MFS transporter n=1 Tax=Pseudooceanicola sp. LIPI14-2-Ac024 TaxID=3344875 RepID=UPI0035D09129
MTELHLQPPPGGAKRDAGLLAPEYRGAVLAISAGIGMHAFNDLSISASIPVAFDALGNLGMLPLAYALFFIGIVAGGVVSAHLRGRFGARATGLAAACVFLLGTVLTAVAPAPLVFAVGRLCQGLSDGVIAALCYSLIPEIFAAGLVARVFSIEAVVWATAAALGPVAGGYATETLGWRAAMLVGVPLALVFLVAGAMILPDRGRDRVSSSRRAVALGPVAICLGGVALLALPTALPGHPAAVLGLPLGLALIALALRIDGRKAERFFPREAFRRGVIGRGTWVMFLMPVAQAVSTVFLAMSVRAVWGLSPIWTGWIVVTMAMFWSLSAFWVARLSRSRRQALLAWAPAFQVTGALMIATGLSSGVLILLIAGHALSGCGFGFSWGPANERVMEATPEGEKSRTASFMPTVQTTGFAVGAGLFGWLAGGVGLVPAVEGTGSMAPVWVVWGGAAAVAVVALAVARGLRED